MIAACQRWRNQAVVAIDSVRIAAALPAKSLQHEVFRVNYPQEYMTYIGLRAIQLVLERDTGQNR